MLIFLIILGIFLIFLNVRAIKKEDKSFNSILKDKSENMEDIKLEIGNMRRDFAETVLELQLEIKSVKEHNEKLHSELLKIKSDNNIDLNFKDNNLVSKDNYEKEVRTDNSDKVDKVKKLINNGYSEEDICEELSIGKGELLLIKELYI